MVCGGFGGTWVSDENSKFVRVKFRVKCMGSVCFMRFVLGVWFTPADYLNPYTLSVISVGVHPFCILKPQ